MVTRIRVRKNARVRAEGYPKRFRSQQAVGGWYEQNEFSLRSE